MAMVILFKMAALTIPFVKQFIAWVPNFGIYKKDIKDPQLQKMSCQIAVDQSGDERFPQQSLDESDMVDKHM